MDFKDLEGYKITEQKKIKEPRNTAPRYGWRNMLATVIDGMFLNVIRVIIVIAYIQIKDGNTIAMLNGKTPQEFNNILLHSNIIYDALYAFLATLIISCTYYSLMFSSKYSATLGFMAAKLKFVHTDGTHVSVKMAAIHYILSLVSFVFLILAGMSFMNSGLNIYGLFFGLIFILWRDCSLVTRKKQAFHDILCKTMVIKS